MHICDMYNNINQYSAKITQGDTAILANELEYTREIDNLGLHSNVLCAIKDINKSCDIEINNDTLNAYNKDKMICKICKQIFMRHRIYYSNIILEWKNGLKFSQNNKKEYLGNMYAALYANDTDLNRQNSFLLIIGDNDKYTNLNDTQIYQLCSNFHDSQSMAYSRCSYLVDSLSCKTVNKTEYARITDIL